LTRLRRTLGRRATADCDEGAVAILVALLATVLLGMAAFAIDIGNAYAVKRQLSVAADSAALDGARAAAAATVNGVPILSGVQTCTNWTPQQQGAAQIAAQSAANATNAANSLNGQSTVSSVQVSCVNGSVQVAVDNGQTTPSFFGGVFGANNYHPNGQATARIVWSLSNPGGLRPFAVCNTVVNAARAAPTTTFAIDLDNKVGICGTSESGNWGLVSLDNSSHDSVTLRDWIQNGYPAAVEPVPGTIKSMPGNGLNSATSQMDGLIDQIVLFPVVTGYVGNKGGSNGQFTLVGFVAARVCGYQFNAKSNTSGSCWDSTLQSQYGSTEFIEFQYAGYTTGYTGQGPTCTPGTTACAYALPAAQLYK